MTLIDPNLESSDKRYLALREESSFEEQRQYLQTLWQTYSRYADPGFSDELARQFHPRFWEMYLGCALLDTGLEVIPKSVARGPDFHIRMKGLRVWVEAIAPDEGQGEDAVPGYSDEVMQVPEEKIILRLTHAVRKKFLEFKKYLDAGLVGSSDALVIAVNGFDIPHSFTEDEVPYIVKSVLPFGDFTVTIDVEKMEMVDQFYKHRTSIQKKSGSEVPTKAFQEPNYRIISGIIYSRAELWNLPTCLGSDFIFVHNPIADIGLDRGWTPRARSIWVEDDQLKFEPGSGCP